LLTAHPESAAIWRVLMDATNVRAHRCAAGAPKKGLPPSRVLVGDIAREVFDKQLMWSTCEQGLGRSRGGFSTKMVLTALDENTPIAVEVLPGQVHEATQVEKMLDATQARLPQIEEAVADEGFDGEPQRRALISRNIRPVIPYRVNRRKRGRLNRKAYAERNKPERLIGKLKEFSRITTRYDKLKETFLGIIQLALAYICLKANLIVNRA
jgi:transposase